MAPIHKSKVKYSESLSLQFQKEPKLRDMTKERNQTFSFYQQINGIFLRSIYVSVTHTIMSLFL